MHESTQKALCRLAFVLLCALPTGLVIALILTTWTPWYHDHRRAQMETLLSNQLGMRVRMPAFEAPAPGMLRFHGVSSHEPETDAEVGKVRLISFAEIDDKRVLRLHQPELQSAQLAHAWHLAHDRFF